MKALKMVLLLTGVGIVGYSQQDTIMHSRALDSVIVISYLNQNIIRPLSPVQGSYIFSGKKTEVIDLAQIPSDIANKTGRQLFAKIPGVFVYDMDGAGNQVNIASRGLDPHRGWEFNTRKDGIITNSDMYGYPASHYSMPLESIARIEIVRGTGSLQYGAQFGGMLNYITKQGDTTRPFSFESINTIGSYNLLSTYNAVGGKSGKFKYYAYMHKKSRNGYRDNEHTESEAEAIILTYEPTKKMALRVEWARSKYLYRIPGALTDSMFHADPTQATRSRNYFSPDIHIPSVNLGWEITAGTKLQLTLSAVLGKRNSVLFDKPTNVRDTINVATLQYNNRQVDVDRFNSYTTELRLLHEYGFGKNISTLATGIQYMNNDLHRTQLGKGTTGSDYDLSLVETGWGRDVHLKTKNIALFAENRFQLLSNLSVNAGARIEIGQTDLSGTINYYPNGDLPVIIKHEFPLLGVNFSYKPTGNIEVYGGWSQAYHPMLFKDLIPGSLFEKVDPNIKDAKGYNAELGLRGNWRFLRWDVNGFLLRYDNRFGTLAETDNSGAFYTYRTNIGNSLTRGAEIFIQADWVLAKKVGLSLFTSTAFLHARYKNATIKSGNQNVNINGNKVESAPDLITRNGVSVRYRKFSFSTLYSYTADSFADALNTVEPLKTTGAVGLVPSYGILDLNASFRFTKNLELRLNINNLTDKQYFTKRPTFYPGPGVWPSEGRNASVSFIVRL
ncbi:MAG: TonB-dependent receptor family protein [Chitinophagaceae bacterium]